MSPRAKPARRSGSTWWRRSLAPQPRAAVDAARNTASYPSPEDHSGRITPLCHEEIPESLLAAARSRFWPARVARRGLVPDDPLPWLGQAGGLGRREHPSAQPVLSRGSAEGVSHV